jgi:hypothetical protein
MTEIFQQAIRIDTKTIQLRSISWGEHSALWISSLSLHQLVALNANRRAIKLWHACRNAGAATGRRRKYWLNKRKRLIRSIDMDGR